MYKIKKMTIIIIYEVDVRGKRGVVEEKKSMAKLKGCPNKLISLLGVKKTPQMRAMLTLHYSSTSDARFFFSLSLIQTFLLKEESYVHFLQICTK